jgi:hypothetical protein
MTEPVMTLPNGDTIRVGEYGVTSDGRKVGPMDVSLVKLHLEYDPETGIFRTKTNRRNIHVGDVVGSPDKQGYIITTIFKRPIKLHRAAWALVHGAWPNGQIDHIDGDKANNRIENLRVATNAQNKQNISKPASNNSGYLGVSFHRASGKWAANIKTNGKSIYLGLHETPEDASTAYRTAKTNTHPFSALQS